MNQENAKELWKWTHSELDAESSGFPSNGTVNYQRCLVFFGFFWRGLSLPPYKVWYVYPCARRSPLNFVHASCCQSLLTAGDLMDTRIIVTMIQLIPAHLYLCKNVSSFLTYSSMDTKKIISFLP